ncbi:proline iminopeptidase-family hydrolase [Hymenobacter sp. BT190]|uniref:proline iminopeptidase-family hydrolase n=1 Tax=Hymenobacter sp. BT190 TaxID=2763505 RepID=UPI0016513D9D|nr:proline iminopeptidase-family hydrolase [Hymenobacter sp. BT190]MBC6697857.1 proline iminopeptidase-family hydrolase [Hymenobacter sp. BT190]
MYFHRLLLAAFLLLTPLALRAQAKDSSYTAKMQAPGVRLITVDGKYKVWTQRIGKGKTKLLLLHGGPANSHEYFENFPEYLTQEGVEIYFYDQLGSYHSDQPKDTAIWRINRFVEEVEQVRQGLGLDKFFLLGHSWGGLLALEYAHRYPRRLKGLIISDMGYSAPIYNKYRFELYADIIRDQAAAKNRRAPAPDSLLGDAKMYPLLTKEVQDEFFRRHMMRLPQEPEPYKRNLAHINRTDRLPIFRSMATWDFTDRLAAIRTPTLLLGAQHDFIPPSAYDTMHQQMPNSQVYICPIGAHFAMWDDPQHYFPALLSFLKKPGRKG